MDFLLENTPTIAPALQRNAALQGHSQSSMRAAIESALSADPDLDCTEISVTMLGQYAVLEGFAHSAGDIVRAMMIAEDVVGQGNVQSRMLRR